MFEEVPRERRGLARWLLAHPVGFGPFVLRPLALGPFVLGGGMLLVAVGGSVAVAAAATVLTASAIGSDDVPPRPPHALAAASPAHPAPARPSATRPANAPASPAPATGQSSDATGAAAPATTARTAPQAPASSAAAAPSRSPASPSVPAVPPASGSGAPAPSSSGPLGNAVIRLSGYDPATARFSYRFAAADPGGDGSRYLVSSPDTYTAALAPTATIVSGGSICPPAGSVCTPDQLIAVADSGMFAEVAIDATGLLRSVIEVGEQPVTARLEPAPSTSASPAGYRWGHPGGRPSMLAVSGPGSALS